jgi:hypothetical protein
MNTIARNPIPAAYMTKETARKLLEISRSRRASFLESKKQKNLPQFGLTKTKADNK